MGFRVRVTYTFDVPAAKNASEAYEAGRRQVPPIATSGEVHCWQPGGEREDSPLVKSLKARIMELEAGLRAPEAAAVASQA